jgi:hypothetical protein
MHDLNGLVIRSISASWQYMLDHDAKRTNDRVHCKPMINIDLVTKVLDTIKGFTSQQLAVMIFLFVSGVYGIVKIDERYAKFVETYEKLKKTEEEIRRHKDEIIQMHAKTLELIKIQPKSVQEEIDRNAKQYIEHFRRLEAEKN